MTMKSTRRSLLAAVLLLAVASPAHAGTGTCAAVAAGGAILAAASLFTGPGIFVTAPTIGIFTGLACSQR